MKPRFQDQVVLISGAAQGIGLASARLFAAEGARLALLDMNASALSEAVAQCQSLGAAVISQAGSVAERPVWDALVAAALAQWGRIDVLINNAGITRDARFEKMSEAQFDSVIDINLRGVFHGAQAVLAAMTTAGRGVILNTSSVVGLHGNYGQTNYAAAKAGVIGMTKTWARELGPKGIRVNAVAPGFIATPMTAAIPPQVSEMLVERVPLGRLGQPEDIAQAYAYLASEAAAYVTGTVLEVSGGLSM
ncbi:3-oxoacyl-[acyl-carrier protein] reductase [Inhella inkyongensis]|uniref:3-oxoacyl-[acyl-carrier protein] reductase n=1 Tax=Inhella inkyongensis TaxID=392593 RepID=A0A840S4Q0_9BURK|nr:3-oxoacyl-ACP reductase FabG [Inhella inkyongensis]MBB5203500.1 3-oxoacyl-[acyl-carrier protein] reductase [Inhella inkyongensis]